MALVLLMQVHTLINVIERQMMADLSLDGFLLIPVTSITSENEIRNFCSSDVILF